MVNTDWVAERTSFPKEVAEKALAPRIPNAVEAGLSPDGLFDKRRGANYVDYTVYFSDAERMRASLRVRSM